MDKAMKTKHPAIIFFITLLLATSILPGAGKPTKIMPLWPEGPAEANGLSGPEHAGGCTGNISKAMLMVYLPPEDQATGAAVVITPGGGYGVVCLRTEGEAIADMLVPRGIAAIVVKYRLPNGHWEIPSADARRAIRTTRHHAEDWHIDPRRIGVWGFSAGGHLASTVTTVFDAGQAQAEDPIERQSSRPDFSILFYPVITMDKAVTHGGTRRNLIGPNPTANLVERFSNENRITKNTPPTFMLHATDDKVVSVENSLRFYRNLCKHNVSAQLLIYERGGHGPSVFKGNPSWLTAWERWMKRRGCL